MLDRSRRKKPDRDVDKLMDLDVAISNIDTKNTSQHETIPFKNPAAVTLGRLGGLKGGKARAAKLSSEQKSEIARKAAMIRWKKN